MQQEKRRLDGFERKTRGANTKLRAPGPFFASTRGPQNAETGMARTKPVAIWQRRLSIDGYHPHKNPSI